MAGLYRSVPSVESKLDSPGNRVINTNSSNAIRNHLQLIYLGWVVCLSWNVIAATTLWIQGGLETTTLFFPIVSLVTGAPAAYLTWYQELYDLLMADKAEALSFNRFTLLYYYLHYIYCLVAAVGPWVGPDGKAFTGLFSALEVSESYGLAGIFYYLGFGLFCVEATLSFLLMYPLLRVFACPSVSIEDGLSSAQMNRFKHQLLVLAFVFLGTLVGMIEIVFISFRG